MLKALYATLQLEIRELEKEVEDEFNLIAEIFEIHSEELILNRCLHHSKETIFEKTFELFMKKTMLNEVKESCTPAYLAKLSKGEVEKNVHPDIKQLIDELDQEFEAVATRFEKVRTADIKEFFQRSNGPLFKKIMDLFLKKMILSNEIVKRDDTYLEKLIKGVKSFDYSCFPINNSALEIR